MGSPWRLSPQQVTLATWYGLSAKQMKLPPTLLALTLINNGTHDNTTALQFLINCSAEGAP